MNKKVLKTLSLFFVFLSLIVSVTYSLAQSMEELQKNAESGDVAAQYDLGHYFKNNAQSLEDLRRAYFWMKQAAVQGMGKAQFFIAEMYCSGSGVEQSYTSAYVWHSLAAENGVLAAEEKMEMLEELFLTPAEVQEALNTGSRIKGEIRKFPQGK